MVGAKDREELVSVGAEIVGAAVVSGEAVDEEVVGAEVVGAYVRGAEVVRAEVVGADVVGSIGISVGVEVVGIAISVGTTVSEGSVNGSG